MDQDPVSIGYFQKRVRFHRNQLKQLAANWRNGMPPARRKEIGKSLRDAMRADVKCGERMELNGADSDAHRSLRQACSDLRDLLRQLAQNPEDYNCVAVAESTLDLAVSKIEQSPVDSR